MCCVKAASTTATSTTSTWAVSWLKVPVSMYSAIAASLTSEGALVLKRPSERSAIFACVVLIGNQFACVVQVVPLFRNR